MRQMSVAARLDFTLDSGSSTPRSRTRTVIQILREAEEEAKRFLHYQGHM